MYQMYGLIYSDIRVIIRKRDIVLTQEPRMANDFDVKVRRNDWANDLFTHIWKFLSLPAIAPSSFYVA